VTHDANGFLPHGAARTATPTASRSGSRTSTRIQTARLSCSSPTALRSEAWRLQALLRVVDGRDETAVAESRERWKAYKAAGHTVVYLAADPQWRVGEEELTRWGPRHSSGASWSADLQVRLINVMRTWRSALRYDKDRATGVAARPAKS